MSRNIKTYKCLQKHLNKTVHVINSDGIEFDAQVGYVGEGCLILHTEDKKADAATGWWEDKGGWSHFCREDRPYQITTELKSIALVKDKKPAKPKKKPGRKKKSYKTLEELKANVGHYCTMADGTTGFIAGSKYPNHVCVIHNSEGPSEGWTISRYSRESEILGVSKSFLKRFSKAWHVGSEDEAEQVKVAEILIKADKSKKAKRKTKESVSTKESFLTREQLLKHIGKRCKMSDGTEGLIVKTSSETPRILMKARANDHGWLYDEAYEHDTGASKEVRSQYKYAWNVVDDEDAEYISVVEILEDDTESSKTILDMTIREVLEKLDEIIKC